MPYCARAWMRVYDCDMIEYVCTDVRMLSASVSLSMRRLPAVLVCCATMACRLRRACRVYRRVLGTPIANDVLVYEEADAQWFVDVGASKDGALVTINCNNRVTSEVRLVRCADVTAEPILVHPRQEGVQYFIEHNKVWPGFCTRMQTL
jgi:hypothetical protein